MANAFITDCCSADRSPLGTGSGSTADMRAMNNNARYPMSLWCHTPHTTLSIGSRYSWLPMSH